MAGVPQPLGAAAEALPVAVVGCGRRGREHAAAIGRVEGLRLVAMVDPDAASRATAAAAHPVQVVPSIGELLDPGALAVVVVATPPAERASIVAEVLAGTGAQAIVVEKPLALNLADGESIVDACSAAGVLLSVSHQSRYTRSFQRLRDAIDSGQIGQLERLHGICFGNLLDQGSHLIDTMRWIVGAPVAWVMSSSEDDPAVLSALAPADLGWWRDPAHPAPAWMTHHLGFGGNVRATVETGLLYQRSLRPLDDWLERRVVATGSRGMAEASAAGRFRMLSPEGLIEEEPSAPPDLTHATVALHSAVRDALRSGSSVDASGGDALATLEVLSACLRSAESGRLVTLPLPDRRRRQPGQPAVPLPRTAAPSVSVSVSVVVNLDDEREFGREAIASWREDQRHDGPLELVLVSDGATPALDRELSGLLLPEDRLVVLPGASRITLYDAGIRAAAGEIAVVTEAHCAAEPGCLGELVAALGDGRVHAALGQTVPVADTAFARLDAEIYERGSRVYGAAGDWRKVVPHAFAIRRSSYLRLGGFDLRYDLFSEQLLAAELRRAGMPIVQVEAARVRHRFADRPEEMLRVIEGFARGQALARTHTVPDELGRLLFPLGALDPTETQRRVAALAVLGGWSTGAPVRRWLAPAVLPPRALIAADTVLLRSALARCRIWRHGGPRLERAYLDMSDIATRRARRIVAAGPGPPRRAGLDGPGTWSSGALAAGSWSGAHEPEVRDGKPFHWIEPAAALVTHLPPGDWQVVLHTGGFGRDPRTARLRIRLDGRPLPEGAVVIDDRSATITVPPQRLRSGRPQCWVVVTRPLARPDVDADARRLGLPIVAVEVRPRPALATRATGRGRGPRARWRGTR